MYCLLISQSALSLPHDIMQHHSSSLYNFYLYLIGDLLPTSNKSSVFFCWALPATLNVSFDLSLVSVNEFSLFQQT